MLAIPIGLTSYGLYKLLFNKKASIETLEQTQQTSQNWFGKKISQLKQNIFKSNVLISGLVATGAFALLKMRSINLAIPFHLYAYKKLGLNYWHVLTSFDKNIFSRSIKEQFDNGNLINASLSITAGLFGAYLYELGNSNKKPKKPRYSFKQGDTKNNEHVLNTNKT